MALEPLQTLYEAPAHRAGSLPESLRALFDGDLSFEPPVLYANFVSSLDGVVALDPSAAPYVISGRNEGDRFQMGLLRALSDAVLIAAGTMRADRGHRWTPDYIYPPAAAAFRELRIARGLAPEPTLVVVTASGAVDPDERGFTTNSLVLTTSAGATRLRGRLPASTELVEVSSSGLIEPRAILDALHERGLNTVLTEGGPNLLTQFVEAGLLDEIFLTLSPVLAGREQNSGNSRRLGLIEGLELQPDGFPWATLRSVKRHGSHLFLRYAFD